MISPGTGARLVRPTLRDAAFVAGWSTSVDEARRWCSREEHPFPVGVVVSWWQADDVQPWLLVDADRTVAYGELWLDDEEDEVELARIIVDPDRRGSGVGRRMVSQLVTTARATGKAACFLRVVPDNEAALRLYRSAGFVDVDQTRTDAWNQGQPTPYTWLELPDF